MRRSSACCARRGALFYGTYGVIVVLSAALILVPGAPLVSILVLTQILNAVLLLPLLAFMFGIARNPTIMGERAASRAAAAGYLVAIGTPCRGRPGASVGPGARPDFLRGPSEHLVHHVGPVPR